jgi:hypothetical protein
MAVGLQSWTAECAELLELPGHGVSLLCRDPGEVD